MPAGDHKCIYNSTGFSFQFCWSLQDLETCLRASANVPEVAGRPIEHRGRRLVDAAVFEPVPFRAAIADGCTHLITLCSRPPFECAAPLLLCCSQAFLSFRAPSYGCNNCSNRNGLPPLIWHHFLGMGDPTSVGSLTNMCGSVHCSCSQDSARQPTSLTSESQYIVEEAA